MSNRYQQAMAQRAAHKEYPSKRLVATSAFGENSISRAIEALASPTPRKRKTTRPVTIKHFSWEA